MNQQRYKKYTRVFLLVLFTSGIITHLNHGTAMPLPSSKQIYIFSTIEGQLTYQGQPAEDAIIRLEVKWKGEPADTDQVTSDANGYFYLPSMVRESHKVLPTQFMASQEIYVDYKGQTFHIWTMGKMSKKEYAELGGKPENLRCELTDDIVRVDSNHGLLGTSCKWDSILKSGD